MVSLTITTLGAPSWSVSMKSRPRSRGDAHRVQVAGAHRVDLHEESGPASSCRPRASRCAAGRRRAARSARRRRGGRLAASTRARHFPVEALAAFRRVALAPRLKFITSTPLVSKPGRSGEALQAAQEPAATSDTSDSAICVTTSTCRRPSSAARLGRGHVLVLQDGNDVGAMPAVPGGRTAILSRRQGRRKSEDTAVERQLLADRQRQRQIGADQRFPAASARAAARGRPECRQQRALGEQLADQAQRLAPSASRTAISGGACWRAPSRRLAMFAQAMSSTMPTTVIRIIEICTTPPPSRRCLADSARLEQRYRAGALRPLLSLGNACSSCAKTVFRLADACSIETFGASHRPRTGRARAAARTRLKFGCTTSCIDIGTHTDGPPPSSVPVNPRRPTPTTVNGVRLSVSVARRWPGRFQAALPEAVADDDDRRRLLVFLGHERPAERRFDAEQRSSCPTRPARICSTRSRCSSSAERR